MKLADLLIDITKKLKQAGIENPSLDARLLLGHVVELDRAQLLSQSQRVLTETEIAAINVFIARRTTHESVARIIGKREFWGLTFGLNEATLEPRPDSECLIEAVLKAARAAGTSPLRPLHILDLGAGTGCLLLALLHEMQYATGIGIDISPRAVEQATQNAAALHLAQRAAFRTGNWLQGVTEKFDLIVSNPPYIASSDITALMPEVRDYDPHAALDGGKDGLDPYRLLIPQVKHFLNPAGLAAFEVGQGQAPIVADLFTQNSFSDVRIHKDLGGIERCVTAYIS